VVSSERRIICAVVIQGRWFWWQSREFMGLLITD